MKKALKKRPLTTPALRKRQHTLKKRPVTHHSAVSGRPDRRVAFVAAQLFATFPDEAAAKEWFEHIRWSAGRACPYCSSFHTKPVPRAEPMPYWCPACREYFGVKTCTVMHRSPLPLRKWAVALALLSSIPTGISSRQMQRALGIAQSTALALGRRIRATWQAYPERLDEPEAGTDKTRVFPNVHATPEELARALFWRHDEKRVA